MTEQLDVMQVKSVMDRLLDQVVFKFKAAPPRKVALPKQEVLDGLAAYNAGKTVRKEAGANKKAHGGRRIGGSTGGSPWKGWSVQGCVCVGKTTSERMVGCDGCEVWFHYKCIGLKRAPRLLAY
jgi:hypothetical protein